MEKLVASLHWAIFLHLFHHSVIPILFEVNEINISIAFMGVYRDVYPLMND